MKKIISIMIILVLSFSLSACEKKVNQNEMNKIAIDRKSSYFSDFSIEGDKVFFYCYLCIDNNTDSIARIQVSGDFSRDKKSGLIQERELVACSITGDSSVFELTPGRNMIRVCFVGTHGNAYQKLDRLLPEITLSVYKSSPTS